VTTREAGLRVVAAPPRRDQARQPRRCPARHDRSSGAEDRRTSAAAQDGACRTLTLEQLSPRIDEQIDQWQLPGRFNTGGTTDCARLLSWRLRCCEACASVWPPLVYHEQ
jgi:hypothetical protein